MPIARSTILLLFVELIIPQSKFLTFPRLGFDDAFFQQELGWSVEGSLGWTRIVGRPGCKLFELSELR